MYAEHFGFRELPFNNTPDPRFFYSTPEHEEALASLIYGVTELKGFVVLTGEVGTGKTLITRMMLRHFGSQITFATINHAVPTASDLMESICTEFELPVDSGMSQTQLVRTLHDFLLAQFAQNSPVVLVLDEAQNLPADAFERLRMIGNLEADDAKLLQIAIVGQPELQRMFLSPTLRQIRQRVFRSFHLPALDQKTTKEYMQHRLSVAAGTDVDIFNPSAFTAIFNFSQGLPRVINTVCDNALLSAYSAGRKQIDGALIKSVIDQMMMAGDLPVDLGPPYTGAKPPRGVLPERFATHPQETRPSHTDATDVQQLGDRLALQIDGMARRFQDMESAICGHRTGSQQYPAGPSQQPDGAIIAELGETLASRDRKLALKFETIARRITTLERGRASTASDIAQTRSIHSSLSALAETARSLVTRSETSGGELKAGEQRLRKLSTAVQDITRDLRKVLDRARQTASENEKAAERSRAASRRLAEQSNDSQQLAEYLAQISARITPNTSPPTEGKSGEHSAANLPTAILPGPPNRAHPNEVHRMLEQARQSLSGLRQLARDNSIGQANDPNAADEPSTARLARKVQHLLEVADCDSESNKPASQLAAK